MRALLIIVAIVLLLALAGWISFSNAPGRSSVNLETEKIRQDADKGMQSGAELLRKAGNEIDAKRTETAPPEAPASSGP
jgi:hypothetical protein